jgi:hypothetical protein
MQNRKPPFVHIARAPEQQTSVSTQASTGSILARLRERLTGSSNIQAGADLSAPSDTHWEAKQRGQDDRRINKA